MSDPYIPTTIEVTDDYATVQVGTFLVTASDNGARFNVATINGYVVASDLSYDEAVAKLHTWLERRHAEAGVLLAQAAVQGDVD